MKFDLLKIFDIATGKEEGDLGNSLIAMVKEFFGQLLDYLRETLEIA